MRLRLNTYFGRYDHLGQPAEAGGLEPSELTLIFLQSYNKMVRSSARRVATRCELCCLARSACSDLHS